MRAVSILARAAAAAGAILFLGGSAWIYSLAPGVSIDGAAVKSPLRKGTYCRVEAGGVVALGRGCSKAWIEDGVFVLEGPAAGPAMRAEAAVAPLSRGAVLLQIDAETVLVSEKGYVLSIAIFRKDSFVFVPLLHLSEQNRKAAAKIGLRLADDKTPMGVQIVSGPSKSITAWMRRVVSAQFDQALRDEKLFKQLMSKSIFVVRAAGPDGAKATSREIAAAIEDAKTVLRFAITLE